MSQRDRKRPEGLDNERAPERAPVAEGPLQLLASRLGPAAAQAYLQRLQRKSTQEQTNADPHAVAQEGVAGAGGQLPYLQQIQRSFGPGVDMSQVRAHLGDQATGAARQLNAEAYATGNDVAFAGAPSLHTVAHEAAHVVQQRGGVQLKGGVGQAGDAYERHADAVADLVVQGKSSEHLLSAYAGAQTAASGGAIQKVAGQPVSVEQVLEAYRQVALPAITAARRQSKGQSGPQQGSEDQALYERAAAIVADVCRGRYPSFAAAKEIRAVAGATSEIAEALADAYLQIEPLAAQAAHAKG